MAIIKATKRMLMNNPITGPLYKSLASKYGRRQRIQNAYRKFGEETFCLVVNALNMAGIPCFPVFGTLLGLIRESHLIRHDIDIDFGVLVEYKEYDWEKLYCALSAAGFSILRWFEHDGVVLEMAFSSPMSRNVHVDFFTFRSSGDKSITHSFYRVQGRVYIAENELTMFADSFPLISSFRQKEYMGVEVSIPTNAEALLEAFYGSSWRTPDANWKAEYSNNHKPVEGATAQVFVNKPFHRVFPDWKK